MTTIAFIRHGVTNWNLERRAQGQTDIPLNKEGRLQAKALRRRFIEDRNWGAIYFSDLQRAKHTAEELGEELDIAVITDERLREVHFGDIEGTNEKERVEKWGQDWGSLDLQREKDEAILERVGQFMEEITKTHPNDRIIIVSHGALLNDLFKFLLHDRFEKCRLDNTSVTIIDLDNEQWEMKLLNCSNHLTVLQEGKL